MKSTTLKIYGQDWKVRVLKRHKGLKKNIGWTNSVKNEIIVSANYTEDLQKSTLLHELIHIVSQANDIDLSEKEVLALEAGLYSVIDFELR